MAKAKTKPMPFDVWVVETAVYLNEPFVTQYRATRLGPTGMTVAIFNGRPPLIVPAASGRRFFRDYTLLMKFCRDYMEKRRQFHERQARQLGEQLRDPELCLLISKHGSAVGGD